MYLCYGSLLFLALGMETNEGYFPLDTNRRDREQRCKKLEPLLCVMEKRCLCTAVTDIWRTQIPPMKEIILIK